MVILYATLMIEPSIYSSINLINLIKLIKDCDRCLLIENYDGIDD